MACEVGGGLTRAPLFVRFAMVVGVIVGVIMDVVEFEVLISARYNSVG